MTLYEETTIWNWVKNRAPYFGPRLVTSISDLSELLIPSYDFSFYSPRCLFFSIVCKCWFYLLPIKSSQKNSRWEHENNDYVSIFEGYRNPFLRSMEVLKNLLATVQTQSTFERLRRSMVSSGVMRFFCHLCHFESACLLVFACLLFLAAFEILNLLVCFLCHLYHYESSRLIYNIFWLLVFFTVCF